MSRSVLFSVRPEHCKRIASGEKGVELRKRVPKLPAPYKGYLYCTKGKTLYRSQHDGEIRLYHARADHAFEHHAVFNGKVWAEFVCDWTEQYFPCDWGRAATAACVSMDDIYKYLDGKANVNGLHISELKIYDRPRELSEFGLARAPQSWCYVEEALP